MQEKYDDKKLSDKEFVLFLKNRFQDEFVKLYDFLYRLLNDLCSKFQNNKELQELEKNYNKKSINLEQQLKQYQQYSRNPYPRNPYPRNRFPRSSYQGNLHYTGGQSNNLSLLQLKNKIESIKKDKSIDYNRIMSFLKRNIVVFIEFKKYLNSKEYRLPCFNNYQYLFPIESNSNVLDVYYKYLENLQNSKNQEGDVKRYVDTQNRMKEIELGSDSYYNKSNLNEKLSSNSEVLNSNKLKSGNIQSIYKYMDTYKDFKRLLTKEDILNFDQILNNKDKYNNEELKKYIMSLLKNILKN